MTTQVANKVFVFVYDDVVVAKDGQFDEWCAFADNEMEAALRIQTRYNLGGRRLKLVRTFDDRRNVARRLEAERRNAC